MTEIQKGTAEFVEADTPESPTTGERPSFFTKVEVRIPLDRHQDGKAACDPLRNEDFCRFASILGPEKFLTVLNYIRPQIEETLDAWVLAVGFADGIKRMGWDYPAMEVAERLFEVFLEVAGRNQPAAAYEAYAEATQPLGFGASRLLRTSPGAL